MQNNLIKLCDLINEHAIILNKMVSITRDTEEYVYLLNKYESLSDEIYTLKHVITGRA